jgi:hypothetical protein
MLIAVLALLGVDLIVIVAPRLRSLGPRSSCGPRRRSCSATSCCPPTGLGATCRCAW